jgi:hypothetical protein
MHLGFVFNMMDADLELAMHKNPSFFEDEGAVHMMDDSSALEALAAEFKAEYLALNWDYCAFVIREELPPVITCNENLDADDKYTQALKALEEGLTANGLSVGDVSLLESPEWTRRGEPINYENYAPDSL